MSRILIVGSIMVAHSASATGQGTTPSPDWAAEFHRLAVRVPGQDEHTRLMQLFAVNARMDGSLDEPITRTIDGRAVTWYSNTLAQHERYREMTAARLAALQSIDTTALNPKDRLNLAVLSNLAWSSDELAEFPTHLMPIRWLEGPQRDASMISELPAGSLADFENILAFLRGVPMTIEESTALMQRGLATNVTPPRSTIEREADIIHQLAIAADTDSPFLSPFLNMPASIPDSAQLRFRREARDVLQRQIRPAYLRLDQFFRSEYLPRTRTSLSMGSLPNGKLWYAAMYHARFSIDISPEAVEQLGRAELRRVQASFDSVQRALGFHDSQTAFFRHVMTDPQFRMPDAAALMVRVSAIAKQIDGRMFRITDSLPPLMPYAIEFVDQDRAATSSSAQANAGSWRARRVPVFYLNPMKLDALPAWKLENLTLHEAYPGHLFQMAWGQQLVGEPAFRFANVPAFVEGWGMYSETLGPELGLYREPLTRLGLLAGQLDRALRLVVETGIHLHDWSREQALLFLRDNGMEPEDVNTLNVDRFIARPGLMTAHLVGVQTFLRLRREAESQLGARFDLRKFHVAVLEHGPLPLAVLENQIHEWIARGGRR